MKRLWSYGWYTAAFLSLAGMWFGWEWSRGVFDGWFPLFCIASAQLSRHYAGLEPGFADRIFQSARLSRWAAASIFVVIVGITAWGAYIKYVWAPANDRLGVQEYIDARRGKQ